MQCVGGAGAGVGGSGGLGEGVVLNGALNEEDRDAVVLALRFEWGSRDEVLLRYQNIVKLTELRSYI